MTTETEDKLEDLCADVGIEATYKAREKADGWEHDAWTVLLRYPGRVDGRTYPDISYRMGTGHSKPWIIEDKKHAGYGQHPWNWKPTPPTAAEVVNSLLMDVSGLEEGFEGWASSLGYDTDSRKAEAIYRQCLEILPKLRALLGSDFDKFEQAEGL